MKLSLAELFPFAFLGLSVLGLMSPGTEYPSTRPEPAAVVRASEPERDFALITESCNTILTRNDDVKVGSWVRVFSKSGDLLWSSQITESQQTKSGCEFTTRIPAFDQNVIVTIGQRRFLVPGTEHQLIL